MDEGLHIGITGDNESLKSAIQESERLIDELGEKAEGTGEKLRHIFESGGVTTFSGVKDMFKDFSLDEYVREMDAFIAAGGDAANQAKVVASALDLMMTALNNAPADNDGLVQELTGIVENLKAAKGALEAQVMKEAEAAGMNFSFSSGNSDNLTQEEIDKLEQARNATQDLAEAEQEYQEVVHQRSQLPPPPTDGGNGGSGSGGNNSGGGSTPPTNQPSTPTDNRSIKDIENEIQSLDKTIDKVTSKQGEITAMFDSYRGADAAAMSIGKLNQANDEISDGFAELDKAQDAYNAKIADLEAIAKKQEEALQNLKTAQEQAFASGDSRGAAKALADYAEMQEKLKQTKERLEQTRTASENLGAVIDNNVDVQVRYNQVLDAANTADATNDIEALQSAFDAEKDTIKDLEEQMKPLQEEYADLQERMKGKLSSGEEVAVTARLEQLRKKISEIASDYQTATDRAKKFGSKIGQSIPDNATQSGSVDLGGGDKGGKAAKSIGDVGNSAKSTSKQLGALRMNITSITRGFSAMSKGGANVVAGLAGVGKGVAGLSAQLLTLLANPVVLFFAAIVASIAALIKMFKNFVTGTSQGADMFASWIGYFKGFKEWVNQIFTEVGRKVAEFVKSFGTFGQAIWASLKVAITAVSSWGAEVIGIIGATFSGLGGYVAAIFNNIIAGIKNAWTKTKAFFTGEEVKEEDLIQTTDASKAFDDLKKKAADFGNTTRSELEATKEASKALWQEWTQGFSKFEMPSFKDFMDTYAKIEELQRSIVKREREWTVTSAELEAKQSELQDQLSRSGNVDKLQKMVELQKLVNDKYDTELGIARDQLKVQQEINRLKGRNVSDDDLKAEADLTAKVLGIEQKRNNEVRSLKNQHIDLTRQIEEQQREQQRILANNTRDREIAALQQKLKYEKDLTKQLEIQDQIRQKQLEKELDGINKQQQGAIKTSLGAEAEQAFANGASKEELKGMFVGNDAALAEIDRIFEYYDQLSEDARKKSEQQGAFADYDKDYQAYMQYCEEVIAAEEWKQQELAAIAAGESNMTEEQVNLAYNNQIEQAGKNANLDAAELKLTDIAAAFQEKIAGATVEGIEEAYTELEDAINGENNLIDSIMGMTDEQKAARTEALNNQLTADQDIAQDETQDPSARAEAEERIMNAQREILLLSYDQQQLDGQKIKNTEVLERMRKKATAAEQKGNNVVSKGTVKNMRNMKAMAGALGAVGDMADMVANTFGGAMSKKAKKALGVISDVAKTGTSVISGIENLVNVATKGMTVTAATGVSQMSALEKASFILTILSVAVQAITAIAGFLMKFTAAAQMQEQIDEYLAKVDLLKKEHDQLERVYQRKSGTEYYKGLAEAAKDYDKIINEQKKALEEAQKLYEYQSSRYGADSGKAQEAYEQQLEIQSGLDDLVDSQLDAYEELMEGLSGTDLDSFSSNLADSLIEGFKQGKEGINDVWEDTMDDLMRTMMKQQLALAITDMFDDVFKHLNQKTSEGDLTQAEIDEIMAEFEAKSEQAKYLAEQYYNMMSERGLLDDDADAEASQGFGQMTQDQADTLTARFTALQIEGANLVAIGQLMYEGMLEQQGVTERQTSLLQSIDQYQQLVFLQVQEHLDQLQIIADNTALLSETNTRLRAIEQNTDKL